MLPGMPTRNETDQKNRQRRIEIGLFSRDPLSLAGACFNKRSSRGEAPLISVFCPHPGAANFSNHLSRRSAAGFERTSDFNYFLQ